MEVIALIKYNLPTNWKGYKINWSVESILKVISADDTEKALSEFFVFLPSVEELSDGGVEFLTEFLKCGNGDRPKSKRKSKVKSLDYFSDWDLIVSAFRKCYGVSANELLSMHWWEFNWLFVDIKDTLLNEVMFARVGDKSKLDSAKLAQYNKLKKQYPLPKEGDEK